ncbi:AEC family transporter [Deinococcus peraridilitoris]|uniref:Putative permease n=1 Tax=Deinococcus peraridilitoris (strain DSM 19664 / LMG 22246 / CIP 109416 / KR-200) TaxID=937777 RepID=L0A1S7_DEIPD|nr:AEC family transporter [Deinococcus peraridilitoris]AFZ67858.1 putative permease [Deinococcus peraridilitoris DSM 19664]
MPLLGSIFLNTVVPVFVLVLMGVLAGPRLGLDARTLSRVAYYLLIPAYVFDVLARAELPLAQVTRMGLHAAVVHLLCAILGYGLARLLRRPPNVAAAYALVAVFGNVGNFGLPIVQFDLGPGAQGAGTVYFLAILTVSFVVGVAVASAPRGVSGPLAVRRAVMAVVKTPALLAIPPAVLVNALNLEVPLAAQRAVGLLGSAMIPIMLLALGVQLASSAWPRLTLDVVYASGVRLLAGPLLALLLAAPFGVTGLERSVGVLQSAMPAAVLASIIAIEYELLPQFVTACVLFSTLASLLTLTAVLALY